MMPVRKGRSPLCTMALVWWGMTWAWRALGEDPTQPTLQSMIGGWFFSSDHSYMAESRVQVPLLRVEPLSLYYRYHELTPVLKRGSQTESLTLRAQGAAEYQWGEHLRLIAVGGYHRTAF